MKNLTTRTNMTLRKMTLSSTKIARTRSTLKTQAVTQAIVATAQALLTALTPLDPTALSHLDHIHLAPLDLTAPAHPDLMDPTPQSLMDPILLNLMDLTAQTTHPKNLIAHMTLMALVDTQVMDTDTIEWNAKGEEENDIALISLIILK